MIIQKSKAIMDKVNSLIQRSKGYTGTQELQRWIIFSGTSLSLEQQTVSQSFCEHIAT